jgi:hypothetical protein
MAQSFHVGYRPAVTHEPRGDQFQYRTAWQLRVWPRHKELQGIVQELRIAAGPIANLADWNHTEPQSRNPYARLLGTDQYVLAALEHNVCESPWPMRGQFIHSAVHQIAIAHIKAKGTATRPR